jgi:hypothetical protein
MMSVREKAVADHLMANRPKMYQQLVRSGSLEATARQMWEDYTDQLQKTLQELKEKHPTVPYSDLYNQAVELCREIAFPPSEQDQPHLGEDPSAADPTTLTTTKSAKATISAKAASGPKPNKT